MSHFFIGCEAYSRIGFLILALSLGRRIAQRGLSVAKIFAKLDRPDVEREGRAAYSTWPRLSPGENQNPGLFPPGEGSSHLPVDTVSGMHYVFAVVDLGAPTKNPAFYLACCFALGILLAHEAHLGPLVCLLVCGACLVAGLIAWAKKRQALAAWLMLAGFVFAGATSSGLFARRFPADHVSYLKQMGLRLDQPVELVGTLTTAPLQMPYGLECDLKASRIRSGGKLLKVTGKVRLYILNGRRSLLPAASLDLHYGDSIQALARLRQPHNYENPGGFDYRRWLRSIQDIYWVGTVEDPKLVRKLAPAQVPFPRRIIEDIRGRLSASIDSLYPPWTSDGPIGAVLKAILLGDRSSLDSTTIENFRKSGLYHLLVVAGLHVGILAMLVEVLLRLLGFRATWRTVLLLAFLAFYALLVEERAPTLRAGLMIAVYLVARLLDRQQTVLNAVGLAALILLFYRPAWLFEAGFELSFAAVLLIAGLAIPVLEWLTEPYRRAVRHLENVDLDLHLAPRLAQLRLDLRAAAGWLAHRWPWLENRPDVALKALSVPAVAAVWVVDLFIFSLILQCGLLLPMAGLFHRVTLAGIGLNVLAIPWMTLLLAVAVPVVVLNAIIPALVAFPAKILIWIMHGLFALTSLPRLPHWLSYRVPSPPGWVAWGFALSVIAAACLIKLSRRVFGIAVASAVLFGLLVSVHPFAPRLPSGIIQITDLDCGGGDSLFVVLPDRTTILVGACGGRRGPEGGGDPFRARRWDPGDNIVSPYLWSRGIREIDVLAVPDVSGDRLSGVASVLRNFRVKEFWYGALPPQPEAAELLGLLEARGTRARQLEAGDVPSHDGTVMTILRPPLPNASRRDRGPGRPLAMRISGSAGSFLLAGNLTEQGQESLLLSGAKIRCLSLEAPTRRGRLSLAPEFLARAQPRVVLIGSGESSAKGKVFQKLIEPIEPRILSTALDGAITVEMKAGKVSVNCYRAPCR